MEAADTRQAETNPPVFDDRTLLVQLGGDRNLAATIIESALADLPSYFDRLEQAVALGDWHKAAGPTHTMKALIAQIGGARLSARLKGAEGQLKCGGGLDAAAVSELRVEYRELTDALQHWLGHIQDAGSGR